MLSNILINQTTKYIYPIAIFLSIIISYITIQDSLINIDGIIYTRTAYAYLNGGYIAAKQIFPSPFYSILIGEFSRITGTGLLTSGYLLNSILQCITVVCFINIFKKFNPSNLLLLIALITILVFPQFNDYRHSIVRDHGFWAFSLAGICCFLNYIKHYYNNNTAKLYIYMLGYYLSFCIAFLFKTDALILAAALPFSLLFIKSYRRCFIVFIKPIALCILISLVVFIILFFTGHLFTSLKNTFLSLVKYETLKQTAEFYNNSINAINSSLFSKGDASFSNALILILTGLFFVLSLKYISVFNIVFFLLAIFFIYNFKKINKIYNLVFGLNNIYAKVLAFAFAVTLALPSLYLYLTFIASGRYFVLSCLILLLIIPFSVHYILTYIRDNITHKSYKLSSYTALSIIFIAVTLNGLVSFSPTKQYVKDAGLWFAKQDYADSSSLSNNQQLNYYAGIISNKINFDTQDILSINSEDNINYFLLKIKGKDKHSFNTIKQLEQEKKIIVLNSFNNRRNDSVYIVKII